MSRVDNTQSRRLHDEARALGPGLICPAGAHSLHFDVYGREVSERTLDLRDAACSQYTYAPARRFIEFENIQRPVIPVAAAGLRGGDDGQNVGRGLFPRNVYDDRHNRGGFVKHYPTVNNIGRDPDCPKYRCEHRMYPKADFGHDATSNDVVFRG